MADFGTIKKLPSMPEGLGLDFDRTEDKEFRIAGQQPCEIYYVIAGTGGAYTIPTGFSRVLGGYVYSITDTAIKTGASVIPSGDGSVASVSGLPLSADTHIIVVFGDK